MCTQQSPEMCMWRCFLERRAHGELQAQPRRPIELKGTEPEEAEVAGIFKAECKNGGIWRRSSRNQHGVALESLAECCPSMCNIKPHKAMQIKTARKL